MDLDILKESVDFEEIKEELKWAINGIDIIGCELAQNIAKNYKMVKNNQTDPYGNYIYYLDIEDHGTPHIIDFADEKLQNRIIDPDEIIIPDEKITLRIIYPLSVEVLRERELKGGFSRKDLFRWIYEEYKKIYEEEEKQVGDPGTYERLYNRKKSSGPYGIWGHYLNDLYLEFIRYDLKTKTVNLAIGS